jgi:hypothetical protein
VRGRQKLSTRVAPTTAAVFLDAERALAPLSDGTMVVLRVAKEEK